MSGTGFFGDVAPIRYEGPQSANPLAFRYYDRDKLVLGKRMEDHLRAADLLLAQFRRRRRRHVRRRDLHWPWFGNDDMANAKLKADVAFEMFDILGFPFFTFHDRDIAPEGATLAQSNRNVREIADLFARKMETRKVKLLWGTANLFSPAATWRARRPIPTRTSSPTPRRR